MAARLAYKVACLGGALAGELLTYSGRNGRMPACLYRCVLTLLYSDISRLGAPLP